MLPSNCVLKNSISSCVLKVKISFPEGVEVEFKDHKLFVRGKLGSLLLVLHKCIFTEIFDGFLVMKTLNSDTFSKSIFGTMCSLFKNMIVGVTIGFTKKLRLVGVGYRASIKDNMINLTIGFSHVISYTLPKRVLANCFNQNEIVLTGIDKQIVGQVAADLRSLRPPEPFKGKGIRYLNEFIRIKDAKKSK